MRKPIKIAVVLVVALVVECVNVFALGIQPIKGYTEGHPTQFERIRDVEQMILHYPGILAAFGLMHLSLHLFYLGLLIAFLYGYLETALLIMGGVYCFRSVRTLIRKSARV